MFTIRPPEPAAIRRFDIARVIRKQPVKLVSVTWRQSSGGVSTSVSLVTVPALLIRMLTGPKACSAAFSAASILTGSVTLIPTGRVLPPISLDASAHLSARRAASTTEAPASARNAANARPSPDDAPVTSATCPANEKSVLATCLQPVCYRKAYLIG